MFVYLVNNTIVIYLIRTKKLILLYIDMIFCYYATESQHKCPFTKVSDAFLASSNRSCKGSLRKDGSHFGLNHEQQKSDLHFFCHFRCPTN